MRQRIVMAMIVFSAVIVSACVHKVDVQQGNVFTQETLAKLQIGMEQRKIMGLVGTPLINDPFRNNRWEYVYRFYDGDSDSVQYSYVSLYFENEKLTEIKVHAQPLQDKDINTLHSKIKRRDG